MTWKDIIRKGDASDMEEDYGMRSDQIVDRFASQPYITLSDPKTDEYVDFDYDDLNEDYIQGDTNLKEGSKLHRFIMETNKPDGKVKMAIHPSNKKEIDEMGFELEV